MLSKVYASTEEQETSYGLTYSLLPYQLKQIISEFYEIWCYSVEQYKADMVHS